MTNRGRPRLFPETSHLSMKLDVSLKIQLESYAEEHNLSMSEVIRRALVLFFKKQGSHYNDRDGILRSRKL